jgi:probable addiction module antidote protein
MNLARMLEYDQELKRIYVARVHLRYQKATRKEKVLILDEFCEVFKVPAGMTFTAHSPADGDKEAVQDILGGLVRTHSITEIAKKSKIRRATIHEAIDKDKNPSLETICKLMKAIA